MDKTKRNERLSAIVQMLTDRPNRILPLGVFCDMFSAAKSTVSEDIDLIASSLARFGLGRVETIAGAAGGVRFRSFMEKESARTRLSALAERLGEEGRILPGGFLYTSDVTAESATVSLVGRLLAQRFYDEQPDVVLTMETKGIPVAMMTAHELGVDLVIARRDSRAYEGSAVKINYVGGSDKIETMALGRRAVRPGQKALIIDDFMKGGGTLKGMIDLMHEFQAQVVGVGVMIATREPEKKLVDKAHALLVLDSIDRERNCAVVRPSEEYL